jgi:hypothetical protein
MRFLDPFEEVPRQRHDLFEVNLQRPVAAVDKMEFGVREVP